MIIQREQGLSSSVGAKLLAAESILASLGNSQTEIHNDSSRFVKHVQLKYTNRGQLAGGMLCTEVFIIRYINLIFTLFINLLSSIIIDKL